MKFPLRVDGISDLSDFHVDPPEVDVVGKHTPRSISSTKLIMASLLNDEGPLSPRCKTPHPTLDPLTSLIYPADC